jgi:thioredoxin reductase (NADPH)
MSQKHDVVIIGAGPAGLSAAIYTGRSRLDTLVLERAAPGGQILLTDYVENYPGFPEGVVPFQLMEDIRKQADKFGAKIVIDDVKEVQREKDHWKVIASRDEYRARAVIVATGSSHRRLDVEGEKELIGRGVSYCATCDGAFFMDKDVAVVGGGNWALTEAIFLTRFCKTVKIIHRRDQFRGEKILQERVFGNQKIKILWNTVVEKISGPDTLKSITVRDVKDNRTSEMKLDGLFVSIGTFPNSEVVKDFVHRNEWGEIQVGSDMSTPQPGLYAAGDVTNASPQQMATAVGTGRNLG